MEKNKALVSVIVPVYNVERTLDKCILSILNQTYENFELILVNDGSPDNSGEICEHYAKDDTRIKVIHKENGGLSSARNAGIDIAQGDFLLFLDSDDFLNINTLQTTVSNCIENDCDVCIFASFDTPDHDVPYDNDITNNTRFFKKNEIFEKFHSIPEISQNSSACNKLFKRKIFETLRFPVGQLYEDTAVIYKAYFLAEKICITDAVCYYYYLSPNSIMRSDFKIKNLDILLSLNTNIEFFEKTEYSHIVQNFQASYEYNLCRLYARLCLSDTPDKKEIKNKLKAERKQIANINKDNPYMSKPMKILANLFYYFPSSYKFKNFMR